MNRLAAAAALALAAGPALAHPGLGFHASALAGLTHPMLGADHLLSMVAIGVLAATYSGTARVALPLAFVGAMGAGLATGALGLALPLVEPMILASLFVLGTLLVLAVRPSLCGGVAMAAVFGLFHGAPHGEAMGAASALPFAAGVLAASAGLHGLGALAGRRLGGLSLRVLGAGLALGGVALAIG